MCAQPASHNMIVYEITLINYEQSSSLILLIKLW